MSNCPISTHVRCTASRPRSAGTESDEYSMETDARAVVCSAVANTLARGVRGKGTGNEQAYLFAVKIGRGIVTGCTAYVRS